MTDRFEKLVELGVLVCYVADALKGDPRLKKAAYHLDRAAGVIADLLPAPPRTQPVEAPAPTAESAPVERAEVPGRKKCGRKRIPICPRCKTAPKAEGRPYCIECYREWNREYMARRRAVRNRADADTAPLPPPTPKPPPATPEPPKSAEPEDSRDQYDRLLAECKKRGYDPDVMLGIAKGLPNVEFRKSGCYLVPVRHHYKKPNPNEGK